jgi:hypothetical protein
VLHSVLLPATYVGQGVELRDAIADGHHLLDIRNGGEAYFEDDVLLSGASARRLRSRIAGLLSRATATAALGVAWPVLLATAAALKLTRGGRVLTSTEVVRLPARSDESLWKTYRLLRFDVPGSERPVSGFADVLYRVLPGLVNVARGDLRLVGVPPRRAEEVRRLPDDWRALYQTAEAGLITEHTLAGSRALCSEDHYAADAYYPVAAGSGYDLRLLASYARRALACWRAPAPERGRAARAAAPSMRAVEKLRPRAHPAMAAPRPRARRAESILQGMKFTTPDGGEPRGATRCR